MKYPTLLLAASVLLISATPRTKYDTRQLHKGEYKINSYLHPMGVTRQVIAVTVPPMTKQVYYSVCCKPKGALEDLGLHAQVRKNVDGVDGTHMRISSSILNDIITPKGDGAVDVYVMPDARSSVAFEQKKDSDWNYDTDKSRQSFSSGTVAWDVQPSFQQQTFYIGIRNKSATTAEYVAVEVVAVVNTMK